MSVVKPPPKPFNPATITGPDSRLLSYYILTSLLLGPFFPIALIPLLCKYLTLKYRFDDEGISMSWGVLFRQEIHLTYRRIQDIHLTRNLFQRWMGLATVDVQTASGSAGPEMRIEGVLAADELRDFLYAKMRGARGESEGDTVERDAGASGDDVLVLLNQIRDSLQRLLPLKEQ